MPRRRPHAVQKRLFTAAELYTRTEFERYRLAAHTKRTTAAAIKAAAVAAGVMSLDVVDAVTRPSSPAQRVGAAAYGGSAGVHVSGSTVPPPSLASSTGLPSSGDSAFPVPASLLAHRVLSTSMSATSTLDSPMFVHGAAGWQATPGSSPAAGSSIPAAASTPLPRAPPHVDTAAPASSTAVAGAVDVTPTITPATTPVAASTTHSRDVLLGPPPIAGGRDFSSELQELDAAYEEVFTHLRLVHLTAAELEIVRAEGLVPAATLASADRHRALMLKKVRGRPQGKGERGVVASIALASRVRSCKWLPCTTSAGSAS